MSLDQAFPSEPTSPSRLAQPTAVLRDHVMFAWTLPSDPVYEDLRPILASAVGSSLGTRLNLAMIITLQWQLMRCQVYLRSGLAFVSLS